MTSGTLTRRVVGAAAAPPIAIVMTTGANPGRARAIAIVTTHARSGAVLATSGKGHTGMHGTGITIPAGPTAIAMVENAIVRPGMRSRATFTCHVD